jgi:hypothetical protein
LAQRRRRVGRPKEFVNQYHWSAPMTFLEFEASLEKASPPDSLCAPLLALWHDAKGDWDRAHKCVDQLSDPSSMWVHAYLHRKEGDASNSR